MALRIFDRVKQVSSSTGTGNITLGGTPNGFQSFSDVFTSGDTTYICIENGANWEVSRATYGVAGSGTLSRDAVLDSSTGAAINLTGRSIVFCTVPAAKYAYLDPSGEINLSLGGLSDVTITSPATGNILSYNGSQWVNSVPDPGYSDEQAQDAIGGILGSGTDIVLSYNDATPAITGSLTNTTVTPGSYTLTSITVDQKGRVTAASSGSVDLSAYLTSATAASTYVALGGSYSNPTWITSLAWSKLSGLPSAVSNLSGTNTGDQDLSSYATTAAVAAAYLPLVGGTLTGDLKFIDATYDIGKSGATRPRDGFFSRNLTVGGTLSTASLTLSSGYGSAGSCNISANTYYSSEPYLLGYPWHFAWIDLVPKISMFTSNGPPTGVRVASDCAISFSSTTNSRSGAPDTNLWRDAAGILAQRNGTNAQTFRLYETYTSSTSFGTLQFKATGSAYQIGSAVGSAGGSNREIQLGHFDAAGSFTKALTITTSGLLSIRQNQWIYSDDGYERFYLSSTATYVKGPSIIIRNNNNNEVLTIDADGQITHVPAARSSGSPTGWTYTDPSHTGQTASTEATSVNFNLSSTKTFAAGALTTQRAFRIQAPTYAFASVSTITTASTLSISGAPTAGTNATITNAYALNVESGSVKVPKLVVGAGTEDSSLYMHVIDSDVNAVGLCVQNTNATGSGQPRIAIGHGGTTASSVTAWQNRSYVEGQSSNGMVVGVQSASLYLYSSRANYLTGITLNSSNRVLIGTSVDDSTAKMHIAGGLNLRDSTTAQTFRVFNTYTSSTSFENLQFKSNAGAAYQIGSAIGSAGGTTRGVEIGSWDSAGTFTGRFLVSSAGVTSLASTGRVTFGVAGFSNQAYFTSDFSNIGLAFNRSGIFSNGIRCDNGYSISLCAHNNAEAGSWSQYFRVQTLTNGSSVAGQITTTHDAVTFVPLPASTEAVDVNFNFARTVTFQAGALTTQRAFRIQAPTYAFASASTITTASTLSISGAPVAGTNATITTPLALWIESGKSYFADHLWVPSGKYIGHPSGYGFGVSQTGAMILPTVYYAGTPFFEFGGGIFQATQALGIGPTVSGYATTGADTLWYRDAAGIFAQRNGTNAQTFRVYGTYTSSTSFGCLDTRANSGGTAYEISSFKGSAGGSNLPINIGHRDSAGTFTSALSIATTGDATFAESVTLGSTKTLAFSTDVILCRDAANVLAQKNGTNGQTFRLYETYVGSTEFSLFQFRATSAGYQIGSRPGSTGVSANRSVILGHFDSSGTFSSYLSVLTTGVTTFHKLASQNAEVSYTPSGTTQTLVLDDGNHQTLNLTSATGTVTATITVPSKVSAGTIIINQHASAAKGITWAVSSGTIKWLGTQPTWSSDATSSVRIVSWRWNGSIMYLASSEVG